MPGWGGDPAHVCPSPRTRRRRCRCAPSPTAGKRESRPFFAEADPRELQYLHEFDAVLSLGGGAFGHFEDDEDDRCVAESGNDARGER